MWSKSLFCLALCVVVGANKFEDCGSTLGSFSEVRVSGCEGKTTCVLKRNKNVSIEIDFQSTAEVDSLTTVVHGEIFDVPIPFPMSQPDACKDSGLTCPLAPGEQQRYASTLPVLKQYPKVSVKVKWELQNAKGENVVCVLIPAKIQ